MSGFSIYETLRIFTPGVLAVFVFDVSIRMATSVSDGAAGTNSAVVINAIETVGTFAGLALIFGLLLYLIDFPERLRIFNGDPQRGYMQPSARMREIAKGTPYEDHYLSVFFIMADQYLPEELHKRIYLFGALYKIYTDFRLLLVAAVVLSVPLSIASARAETQLVGDLAFDPVAFGSMMTVLLGVIGLGAFGTRTLTVNRLEAHGPDPRRGLGIAQDGGQQTHATAVPRDRHSATDSGKSYLNLLEESRRNAGPCLLVITLMTAAVTAASWLPLSAAWCSTIFAFGALVAWLAVEVGPPTTKSVRWRDRMLMKLGAPPSTEPQFSPWQRTLCDLALYIPAMVGASVAAAHLGREPATVAAWGVLIIPASLIMVIRKHERRLLGAYRHQITWIDLHAKKIEAIVRGAPLPKDLDED